ncbi:MAG: hypothetical protein PHG00_00295 [Methylococcales bacterium]|nr:hypothetical protein [Methylococcales bacterium]
MLDRTTGEVLAADPYVYVNASKGVDLKTGRLIHAPEKIPQSGQVMRNVCPNAPGAKDWELTEVSYIADTPYIGVETRFYPGPGGNGGAFTAWDPVTRKKAWEIKENWPVFSGAAATAGGIVCYGNVEGWFKAVDARTGKLLWQFQTGSGIIGQPTTWRGPDGHQYVAILSGIGGWIGSMVSKALDPRDKNRAERICQHDRRSQENRHQGRYVVCLLIAPLINIPCWS